MCPASSGISGTLLCWTAILVAASVWLPGGSGLILWCAAPPLYLITASYLRSHYDVQPVVVPDGPAPNEVVYALVMTTGERPHARIGGFTIDEVDGDTDGAYAWLAVGRVSVAGLNPSRLAEDRQRAVSGDRRIGDLLRHGYPRCPLP